MNFKTWSATNPDIKKELKPDIGIRNWDSLNKDEKYKIWKYLESFFFKTSISFSIDDYYNGKIQFYDDPWISNGTYKQTRIENTILLLNDMYKAQSYARNYLEYPILENACYDFFNIFINGNENLVLELLSLYCVYLIEEKEQFTIEKSNNENEDEYQKRLTDYRYEIFDKFSERLNEVFIDFGLNYLLTRQGFIPRQEEKIITEIYEPVLKALSDQKWKEVNNLLIDAFSEYRKNTPQGYSNCITNAISSIEGFLQILINGKIDNKGTLGELIDQGIKKQQIPDDVFTKTIFRNFDSILSRERMETSIAHPKKEYGTEKNARLILNIAMIFIQHCMQK